MHVAGAAMVLISQLAFSDAQVIVAKPESPNVVRVGQTFVIPLYDGKIAPLGYGFGQGLRFVGIRRINTHDLLRDVGSQSAFGGYDASSDRGAAFIVERIGGGSVNVTLRLPQLKDRCVSCRTVHFYYRAE